MEKIRSAAHQNQNFVVETITMTTVTERRIIREREAIENRTTSAQSAASGNNKASNEIEKTVEDNESNGGVKSTLVTAILQPSTIERSTYLSNSSDGKLTTSAQIAGILKGGKLWKSEPTQVSKFNFHFTHLLHTRLIKHKLLSECPQEKEEKKKTKNKALVRTKSPLCMCSFDFVNFIFYENPKRV